VGSNPTPAARPDGADRLAALPRSRCDYTRAVLRKNAKIELLRRVPLFSGCSKRELEAIARVTDEADIPAGGTLIREGRPGRECFVIVSGKVEVTRGGRRLPVRGGEELFGEIALLSDRPRSATVTALTPTHVLVLSGAAFRSVLQTTPPMAMKIMRVLAERTLPEP
jgi:CRP/FNR family transcriptional regulator, cyclic AMP receptor protein